MPLLILILLSLAIGAIYCYSNHSSTDNTYKVLNNKLLKIKQKPKTAIQKTVIQNNKIIACPDCGKTFKVGNTGMTECPYCHRSVGYL